MTTQIPDDTSKVPQLVRELVELLDSRHADPVPYVELPERLRDPDVVEAAIDRGLAMRVTPNRPPMPARKDIPLESVHIALRSKGAVFMRELRLTEKDAIPQTGPESYSVAELVAMAGVSDGTVNKYAKEAGVTTPERGQGNFRYRPADARAILQQIIDKTGQRKTRAKCQTAIKQL